MAALEITVPQRFPWQSRLFQVLRGMDPDTGQLMKQRPKRILCLMGRRAGKSTACSLEAGEFALGTRGAKIFWGAHTADGCRIGHETFHGPFFSDLGQGRREFTMFGPAVTKPRLDPLESELQNQSKIYWRSMEGKGAAIGRGWDVAFVDEFDRCHPDAIKQDVIPATADTGGPVVAITTPQVKGLGFEWFNKAQDGNPLYYVIHGSTLQNPSPTVRQWVEEFRQDVGEDDPLYRQEILAEYVEGRGTVFRNIRENASLADWRAEPDPDGLYVLGADLAAHRDFFVLTVLEAKSGELHHAVRSKHIPWEEQARIIRQTWETWGEGPVYIDSTGAGDPVFQRVAALGVRVVPVSIQTQTKTNLVTALRIGMSGGEISYPAEPSLLNELEVYGYDTLPSGRVRYTAPKGKHDDWVISLALAWWGRQMGMGHGMQESMAMAGWL